MGKSVDEVMERFRSITFDDEFDIIVAIANGGVVPAAIINQRLGKDIFLLKINLRDEHQHPRFETPRLITPIDFDFKDKRILLVEDRVKTGATIDFAKELLKGARFVRTFAVNGNADYALYNEACFRFPWII